MYLSSNFYPITANPARAINIRVESGTKGRRQPAQIKQPPQTPPSIAESRYSGFRVLSIVTPHVHRVCFS